MLRKLSKFGDDATWKKYLNLRQNARAHWKSRVLTSVPTTSDRESTDGQPPWSRKTTDRRVYVSSPCATCWPGHVGRRATTAVAPPRSHSLSVPSLLAQIPRKNTCLPSVGGESYYDPGILLPRHLWKEPTSSLA